MHRENQVSKIKLSLSTILAFLNRYMAINLYSTEFYFYFSSTGHYYFISTLCFNFVTSPPELSAPRFGSAATTPGQYIQYRHIISYVFTIRVYNILCTIMPFVYVNSTFSMLIYNFFQFDRHQFPFGFFDIQHTLQQQYPDLVFHAAFFFFSYHFLEILYLFIIFNNRITRRVAQIYDGRVTIGTSFIYINVIFS